MMLIEVLKPVRVSLPEGLRDLEPGKTYDLPDPSARELIDRARDRVRFVAMPSDPGQYVTVRAKIVGVSKPFSFLQNGKLKKVKNGSIVHLNHEQYWAALIEMPGLLLLQCPSCKTWHGKLFQGAKSRQCLDCLEWRPLKKQPRSRKKTPE